MARTRSDLIDEAADLLNIVGAGETLSAEDREKIDRRIDPKIADLSARRIVYIPDADEIEDAYFDALAALVAEASGPSFGQGRNSDARIASENLLREASAPSWGPEDVVEAEYY